MIISGSIYLLKSYINSITHSKHSVDELPFTVNNDTRFIYSKQNHKLYADFIFGKSTEYVAVLYIGYGINPIFKEKLKNFYIKSGYNIVIICANGFKISGKNKKADDYILAEDLSGWLNVIKNTFGNNAKILLHGFSYTALASLNCSDKCYAVFADNTHIFPPYNYRKIKYKFLYKKKSRLTIAGINVPAFFSSSEELSGETYKLYEISNSKKTIYIYKDFNYDVYIAKIQNFIMHLKPPEE